MNKKVALPRFTHVSIFLAIFSLVGCATQPTSFSSFTPEDLNTPVKQGLLRQKVDNFHVIMDASSSMNEDYRNSGFPESSSPIKFDVEKEFLSRMNQTIPDIPLNYGLRTFGFGPCVGWGSTELNAPQGTYSKTAMDSTLSALDCAGGGSPMGEAFDAARDDLQAAQGKIAVIVISDGKQLSSAPIRSLRKLKDQYGDRLCLHTVWVGNPENEIGRKTMQWMPNAPCGTFSQVGDVVSSKGMANFVTQVFLEEAPAILDSDGDGVLDPDDQCPGTPRGARVNRVGCWVLNDVLFDLDKSTIKPVSFSILNDVARVFNNNPGVAVEIDGHTDSTASDAHNLTLSQRRAEAVRDYLIHHGVAASRLSTKGFGESKPVASNDTEQGRALNRRVELTVIK